MGSKNKNSAGGESGVEIEYKNFLDEQVQEQKQNRTAEK